MILISMSWLLCMPAQDKNIFISLCSFCCHCLIFIIFFESHLRFFFYSLLSPCCNIDLVVSATCNADNSPFFVYFFQFQTQTASIVLYFHMSPDTKHAEINGGTAKSWTNAAQWLKSNLASHVLNRWKAEEYRREAGIPAHQSIHYHATALINTIQNFKFSLILGQHLHLLPACLSEPKRQRVKNCGNTLQGIWKSTRNDSLHCRFYIRHNKAPCCPPSLQVIILIPTGFDNRNCRL